MKVRVQNKHDNCIGTHTTQDILLRDYFAAMALQTISAYPPEDVATWSAEDFAKHVYATADAMLEERNK